MNFCLEKYGYLTVNSLKCTLEGWEFFLGTSFKEKVLYENPLPYRNKILLVTFEAINY